MMFYWVDCFVLLVDWYDVQQVDCFVLLVDWYDVQQVDCFVRLVDCYDGLLSVLFDWLIVMMVYWVDCYVIYLFIQALF